ncbi:MAG: hypothetical protein K2X82_27400, partial [Gemmataceae bacterium]|nr:hypothetical protein [Gemmataceae bacterium]
AAGPPAVAPPPREARPAVEPRLPLDDFIFRITAGPGGAGLGPIISDGASFDSIRQAGKFTVITAVQQVQYVNSTVLVVEPAANPPDYHWVVTLDQPDQKEVQMALVQN